MSDRGYLFDTNVLSEVTRKVPEPRASAFLVMAGKRAFVSVLTIGELRRGAALRRPSDRGHADRLDAWIDGMEQTFENRILPVDIAAARLWGALSAERPRAIVDTLIAATAIVHGLTLVTRNVRDFADLDLSVANPWDGPR